MSSSVTLDGELYPGLPSSIMVLPDHWKLYPGESKGSARTWGDPTFNLVKYFPLIGIYISDCPEELWKVTTRLHGKWTPIRNEEPPSDSYIERIMLSRTMLFEDPLGGKHQAYLLGTVSVIDPSRVWEVEEILNGVSLLV